MSELSIIFGAHKLYFMKNLGESFEIEEVFPINAKQENIKIKNPPIFYSAIN